MKIGLYSELARQNKSSKERNKRLSIGSSDAEMKCFRDMIINSDKEHHKVISTSPDSYNF